jgi:hypothetical protein
MKVLFTVVICVFLYTSNCFSEDENTKAKEAFHRYFKSAHPLPEKKYMDPDFNILLSDKNPLPNFLNINATMDELVSEPNKMQNESSIAVNPKNPLNLIASAVDYRAASSTWVYVSSDGGKTWKNLNLGKPFPEWRSTNDPSVMFDNEGIGYLCYGGFGDVLSTNAGLVGENGVFLAKTTDEGKTWKAHIPVIIHLGTQTLDSTFEDKYYVQVDNSKSSPFHRHLYIPWKRVTPRDSATQIVLSKSVDFGESWSKPINISKRLSGSSEDTTFGQSFPLAVTGPDGEVYVIWNHGIEHGIGFAKSLDGGATFTEGKIIQKYKIFGETKYLTGQGYRHVVKGTVRAESYPVIVADISNSSRRGNLYLSWAADNYPNIYFSKSTDKGENWSNPVIIHSDTTNDQFWHWLSIDNKTGDIGVMFLDSRNDPNNIMVECYVSYSSDGGDTWIDRRVSDINSDIRLNPFQGRNFAGDYSGNAFYEGIIYPSWVDMRNAVTNIADSDILTAIINTRAPEAPKDFASKSDLKSPKEINLTWTPPNKRAFGQELKPEEFVHRLVRDGEIISTLAGTVNNFTDSDINAFQKYEYNIYAVAGKDSSIQRDITAYAGGSDKPDIPEIISLKGNENENVDLSIKIPSFRSDKITPLVNVQGIKISRMGYPPVEFPLNPTDTGKTLNFVDKADKIGFHKYRASIFDFFESLNKTTQSDFTLYYDVFTGSKLETLYENFDESPLPYYYVSENWKVTDELFVSGKKCLSNAPYKKYIGQQYDTLIFLPVTMVTKEDLYMTFMQVCTVFPDDSAMIEVSYNDMNTWEPLAHFNNLESEQWRDNELSNADWKSERITIPNRESATRVFVRLRFKSNLIRHGDGWYIDDVVIGPKSVSVENMDFSEQIKIFPNPCRDYVKIISGFNNLSKVKVFDLKGVLILDYISDNSSEVTLDLTKFSSGSYIVEIQNEFGELKRNLLFLTK